jgi:hypothetical protein
MPTEEEAVIRAFVIKEKRERLLGFLPARRKDATAELGESRNLDSRWRIPLAPSEQSLAGIERLLRARGAGADCLVISENAALDGRRMPLAEALQDVVGYGMGTIVSCVPGKLAYFEGEGPSDRFILVRDT